MNNIENEVIKKIEDSKIKPIPKSWFIIKNILFIIGFSIFFCIGAVSISVIISVLTDNVEFYRLTNNSFILFLNILPYFWIALSLVFLAIAYFNSKNINNSYKYFTLKNIVITLLLCLLCGTFLHVIGISSIIEHEIAAHSKIYNEVIYNRKKIFNHPENGTLVGKITDFTITMEKRELNIQDVENQLWKVLITDDTIFKSRIDIKNGMYINVFGENKGNNIFTAKYIKEIQIME